MSLDRKVLNAINDVIGKEMKIKEAYVSEPKKFDLRTELLSDRTKKARQADFEQFVESLNSISAQLDGADREQQEALLDLYKRALGM